MTEEQRKRLEQAQLSLNPNASRVVRLRHIEFGIRAADGRTCPFMSRVSV
jgi:hypothetical protein